MGAAHDDRPHTAGQQGGGDELCRLRSVEFLENRLSPAERQQFSRDGYIVVPDALPAADFNLIDTALDGLYRSTTAGSAAESQGTLLAPVFTSVHTLSDEAAVVRMLTAPAPFAKAVDILGFNIALYHAHLAINPPAGETSESSNWGRRAFGYHQDSGRVNQELEVIAGPTPRLSIKLAFYFSDLLNPGHGQTWVIPGSHRWPASECAARSVALRQWEPDDAAVASSLEAPPGSVAAICSGDDDAERWQGFPAQPPGAIPLAVPPNTCVLFDRRLFHASSPNISAELARKVVFVGYGYRWLRPKDVMDVSAALASDVASSCAVTRQLLGFTHTNNGIFNPREEDTPLHTWLRSIGALDAGLGLDTEQPLGALMRYDGSSLAGGGAVWQALGDAPHSFHVVQRPSL